MNHSPCPLLTLAALGLAGLTLGGCGFTPLYAAPGVTSKLARIEVSRPDGRTGFLMGQDLDDAFVKSRDQPPLYRLTLKTSEIRIPRGIRVNNVASRYELQVATTYFLTDINTRKVITQGVTHVSITYDSADQPYAGIAAEEDGERRAAEQAAERIEVALASFLASPPVGSGTQLAATGVGSPESAATYSERLQPAAVQSPRERALGQPAAQGAAPDIFGLPTRGSTPEPPASGAGPGEPLTDPYANGAVPLAPPDGSVPGSP